MRCEPFPAFRGARTGPRSRAGGTLATLQSTIPRVVLAGSDKNEAGLAKRDEISARTRRRQQQSLELPDPQRVTEPLRAIKHPTRHERLSPPARGLPQTAG